MSIEFQKAIDKKRILPFPEGKGLEQLKII